MGRLKDYTSAIVTFVGTSLSDAFRDILFFGGLMLCGYGLWQLYTYLSFVICGSLLMLFGLGWLTRVKKGGS